MSKFICMEDAAQDYSQATEKESEEMNKENLFSVGGEEVSSTFIYVLLGVVLLVSLGASVYLLRDQLDLSYLGLKKVSEEEPRQANLEISSFESTSSADASWFPFADEEGKGPGENLPEGWKLFRSEEAGFAVGHPEKTVPNESKDQPGSVSYLVRMQPSAHSSFPLVTIKILGIDYETVSDRKDSQRLRDLGYTVEKITAAGKEGLWIIGERADSDDTLYEIDFPTPDGKTLQIISVMSPDEEKEGVDMLKNMLESFSFL